jgi:F-type H+-transporting ATPase subunit b
MNLITPDFGIIFWQTITLLFTLLILGKFAWKPILGVIQQREQRIASDLAAAAEAREILDEVHNQQKQLLEAANVQRTQIIKEAEHIKEAILADATVKANQLSNHMLEQAKLLIAQEKETAFIALKQEVTKLSVELAEKLLVKELQPQDKQEALLERLLQKQLLN